MNIVLTGRNLKSLAPFTDCLEEWCALHTCDPEEGKITRLIRSSEADGVIGYDEDLHLIKMIIRKFPMINFALISSKTAGEFHDSTEGLGIFMQLPAAAGRADAEDMLRRLNDIKASTIAAGRDGGVAGYSE